MNSKTSLLITSVSATVMAFLVIGCNDVTPKTSKTYTSPDSEQIKINTSSNDDQLKLKPEEKEVISDAKPQKASASTNESNAIEESITKIFPNDTHFNRQHHLGKEQGINVLPAWRFTKGENVIVAVIDTGVLFGKDLKIENFIAGYDFIEDEPINSPKESEDDDGHGTLNAAIINQATDNQFGTAGVAPNAKIMPLRALDARGSGEPEDVAAAIRFAVDNGADILNLSLANSKKSKVILEAIQYAYKQNKVIISAAGNDSYGSAYYPAKYEEVIGFGAITPSGTLAPYSNYGPGVLLVTSGGFIENNSEYKCGPLPFDIQSFIEPDVNDPLSQNIAGGILQTVTINHDGEATDVLSICHGTSQASALGAGVAALVVSVLKDSGIQSPETVRQILIKSSRETYSFNSSLSAVKLNAGQAVQLASQITNPNTKNSQHIISPDQFSNTLLERGRTLWKRSLSGDQDYFLSAYKVFLDVERLGIKASGIETKPSPFKDFNALCWDATLNYGKHNNVDSITEIIASCQKAIDLLDSRSKGHEYYQALDSRGIARALTGDVNGAIKDFEKFKNTDCSLKYQQLRSSWITKLRSGENPFSQRLMDQLLQRDCQ